MRRLLPLEKLEYGRTETKRAITNIVNTIIREYNFTSLPELNAVLKQYNVIADRGNEDSIMFQKKGLVYSATDDNGKKVGVAIKASDLYNKPTLKNLEKQFQKNDQSRKLYKELLKERIDKALADYPKLSRNDMTYLLKQQNIKAVFRQNKDGLIYGITYIDQFKKSVFNGSDLGKEYAANAMNKRFVAQDQVQHQQQVQKQSLTNLAQHDIRQSQSPNVLGDLLSSRRLDDYLPGQLVKKRKRKKKQGQHLKIR